MMQVRKEIEDTRKSGNVNRFPGAPDKIFAKDESTYSIELSYERYFIDAEWDGGNISKDVVIPLFCIRRDDGDRSYFWKVDYITLEYLCGKKPIDELDAAYMKSSMFGYHYGDFPLKDTYYKNLKINKIAKYVEKI